MVSKEKISNEEIAGVLERISDLLEVQDANPFRIQAYRTAAQSVRDAHHPIARLVGEEGPEALQRLPGVGPRLAGTIMELVDTGRSNILDRLVGQVSPEEIFTNVPGIGAELARRIASQLELNSLEELEVAAHSGLLATVKGFGPRRIQAVRHGLAGMLGRSGRRRSRTIRRTEAAAERGWVDRPSVPSLLDVDAEYRWLAEAGKLRMIAPRRLNPEGKAWLPVMRTNRGGWSFSVLFSNTVQAHKLGTTGDWVVIYFERNGSEGQCTVVTARSGPLRGNRVVRGRETECLAMAA